MAAAMEKVARRLQRRTAAQAPWGVPSDIEGPPTSVPVSDQIGTAEKMTSPHRPRIQRGPRPAIA
jgi:hypothetical protein